MKRIITLFFAAMLAGQAWAQNTFTSNGLKYTVTDETNHTVSVSKGSTAPPANLVIPSEVTYPETDGVKYTVTAIGKSGFRNCSSIISLTIPETITTIGKLAFDECVKLKDVFIPNSVKTIGDSAFSYCYKLASLTTDNDFINYKDANICITVNGLKYKLLTKNTLQVVANSYGGSFNIPGTFTAGNDFTVVSISAGAFRERVVALKSVVIPNTVDSIAAESFYRDMEMTSAIIGNSVKSIGDNAFYDCTSLTTITIPNSVTKIGKGAFRFCYKLDTIIISNSLTSIGDGAFYSQGEGNPSAIITESDADFSNADIYFTKDEIRYMVLTKNTVEITKVFNLTGDVVIPTTVTAGNTFTITSIRDYALENKTNITSITIPNTVTKIGKEAFKGCSGLTKAEFASMESLLSMEFGSTLSNPIYLAKHLYIENKEVTNLVIPDGVTSIGTKFRNCCGLTSVTIPNSVTEIRNNAFDGCSSLTSINIPESVTTIGDKAFNNCSGLISVTIPKSVTSIGNNAFSGCSSVETLTYNTNAVGSIFKGIKTLKTVNIGNSVTNVPDEAFNGCSELASITIPDAVTSIGARAFYGCSGVKSITIPNSVTTIGSYAFNGCNNVETLSYNTRAIGAISKGMKKLKTVIIGDSITSIAAHMFNGCSSLTSVTIPNSVKTIGQQAFDNCTSLDLLIVPDSVTSIGGYAFEDVNTVIYSGTATGRNWGAKTVLSNAVTDGDWLYSDSTKIQLVKYLGSGGDITIPNTVKSIENGAFRDCTGLTSVTISDSVKSIGVRAFDGCTNLAFNEYNNACYLGNSKNQYLALIKPKSADITSCSVNSKCQIIANKAFLNCSLISIIIPESVTVIGDEAFDGCTELTSISILSDANIYPANICFTKDKFKYKVLDKESVEVLNNSYSGDISIPETVTAGKTFNVTSIGYESFYQSDLTSITIPNSVISIGRAAFSLCTNLGSVSIPNSVTSIGGSAFYKCSCLNSVVIPNSVTTIGDYVFENCSGLTSVVLPNSLSSIGSETFSGCNSLNSVVVPNTVSNIGWNAFANVGEVIYSGTASGSPWGAKSVSAYSDGFKFKVNVNNPNEAEVTKYEGNDPVVVIPPTATIGNKTYTVTSISESAFSSCWELKAVYLPNTITSIGATSFSGCYKLQFNTFDNAIYIGSQDNPYYALIKAKDKNITSCQIHSDCKVIASFAFENCEALTSITIPDSVTHIGRMAFNNCSAIENAVVGKSIVEIGNWAFENCKKLKTVSIPTSIKSIGYGVFYGCDNLQYNTFDNALYLGNDINKYVALMMPKADDIQQCMISDSCQIIYESAFLNCASLDSVSIPNSVWSIGSNAFSNTALRSVVLPDSLRTIEAGLFNECTKLTSVTIPNSVTTIDINAFYWCESLKTVALPNGLTQIGGSAFNYCLGLDSILIPMSVDSIGNAAFFRCNKATIYCEADSKPAHWNEDWNANGGTVVWKYCGNGNNAHTSVTDAAVAATCTKSGLTEGSHCSVCGTVIVKQDTIPAKGHTIVIDEAVEPTCTETGLGEGKHCAVCDEYDWTQELLPPLGHEFVNYVYNNDATTEADGTETAVCERGCGATDTRTAEGTRLSTSVSESAANNLMVYAHGNTIIVENAAEEISVYDAMGRLIGRDAINRVRTEIRVNTAGLYIVKVGNVAKRVIVND
ncbi:MAG: leucine-rich repeat domain-containing protein [Salinivirgaceae bacterium]|nr:leucine-rich repeat domain-containing protein [Salinivirgaceae bacterium]